MDIIGLFGLRNIIVYLLIINGLGFLAMGFDKWKAKRGRWRIPEDSLFMFTILGGGIGTIVGIYKFRHKTKKLKFTIGMPLIVILEILLFIYIQFVI